MCDVADEAAHEDHDNTAAAIERHDHTHLRHSPEQGHGHCDHLGHDDTCLPIVPVAFSAITM